MSSKWISLSKTQKPLRCGLKCVWGLTLQSCCSVWRWRPHNHSEPFISIQTAQPDDRKLEAWRKLNRFLIKSSSHLPATTSCICSSYSQSPRAKWAAGCRARERWVTWRSEVMKQSVCERNQTAEQHSLKGRRDRWGISLEGGFYCGGFNHNKWNEPRHVLSARRTRARADATPTDPHHGDKPRLLKEIWIWLLLEVSRTQTHHQDPGIKNAGIT